MCWQFTCIDMSIKRLTLAICVSIFVWVTLGSLASNRVNAQSWFERLVMPSDLIDGHRKLQDDCKNCHISFSQSSQKALCLDCHKDVATDVNTGAGFHGQSKEAGSNECRHCHTDHKGRTTKTVLFDAELFDHRPTDFTLTGTHESVACAACHTDDKKWSQAPTQCIDCHVKVEPHKSALGKECATCHKTSGWTDVKPFDHSKTKFPLQLAHMTVPCSSCHTGEIYSNLPLECVGCHSIQDVHLESMGGNCETCHVITKWTEVRFRHEVDTKFALVGKHQQAKCENCHKVDVYQHHTAQSCTNCHQADDAHEGQLGAKCATCHSPEGWRENVAFDHDITRFPLIGLHVLAPCEECHLDNTFNKAKSECSACHQADDVHKGALGEQCASCHNPNGWALWIFDHDLRTKFRLTGAHSGLVCESCHTPEAAPKMSISQSCISCHRDDDKHRGAFGTNCAMCHSTGKFKGAKLK